MDSASDLSAARGSCEVDSPPTVPEWTTGALFDERPIYGVTRSGLRLPLGRSKGDLVNLRRLALTLALSLAPFAHCRCRPSVSYLVEEKPLKAAIAGTPLTFELYSDNACTTLVQLVPVDVEDVALLLRVEADDAEERCETAKHGGNADDACERFGLRQSLSQGDGNGRKLQYDGDCQAQSAQWHDREELASRQAHCYLRLISTPGLWLIARFFQVDPSVTVRYLHTTEQAALVLSGLTRVSSRHLCDVRTSASASYNDTDLGVRAYLIFGIDNCTNVCADLIQNYDQSDIDCGGTAQCPRCGAGKACTTNSDCLSNVCTGNVCQP